MNSVIWETPDGKWSRGRFADERGTQFEWTSVNHENKSSAIGSSKGEGPYTVVLYSGNERTIEEFEEMAEAYELLCSKPIRRDILLIE